jgi:hypothetical protein
VVSESPNRDAARAGISVQPKPEATMCLKVSRLVALTSLSLAIGLLPQIAKA